MSTESLLRQIQADPADAALRSVYADALMAAGDPRGELIAVELSGADPARRLALRLEHAHLWWPELPAHRIRTRRGFVEAIAVRATGVEACARLFETELVEEIELENHEREALSFEPAAWQARIVRLAIRGSIRRTELVGLGRSSLGAQLESLDVTGSLDGISALADGFPRCRRLALAQVGVRHQIGTLLRWEHLGRLEELDLRSCALDAHHLDELLALDLASLRVLKLSGNPFGDAGTRVLQQRLRHLPALARLELVDCDVTDVTHSAITEREDLPAIIELVGATLELLPTTAGRFGLLVDGVRRRLRYRSVRTEDGLPETVVAPWVEGSDAPLEPLYRAIATSLAPRLTSTGAVLLLDSHTDVAYATSYTTRDTLEIAFVGELVQLEFERHIATAVW